MSFDRSAWIYDYDELRVQVSRNYANLLWAIEERHIDAAALHQKTLKRLSEAHTDRAARTALADFIGAFQDGHFRIDRVPLSRRIETVFVGAREEFPADTDAGAACAALGFEDEDAALSFVGTGLERRATPDNPFPSAIIRERSRTAGLLRIPTFDQRSYLGACKRAWRAAVGRRKCDRTCVEKFVESAVPNQLLAEMAEQVRALAQFGSQLLIIDLTDNGGGTDWAEPAARIVSSKPLACARVSFVKGPHWERAFTEMAASIDADLHAAAQPSDLALLQSAKSRAFAFADLARSTCALEDIWTSGHRPGCSNLVADSGYSACGLLGPLSKDSLVDAPSRRVLFHGLGFAYEEGVFHGRVVVIVNRQTASAAEYFAALLADNDAATLVGERTFGIGCGYTNGGTPAILPRSGLRVNMPDCQRLRRDGSNEAAGIAPDVPVNWQDGDDADAKLKKLLQALAQVTAE